MEAKNPPKNTKTGRARTIGGSSYKTNKYESFEDPSSQSIALEIADETDIMDEEEEEIANLRNLTEEEREELIQEHKKEVKMYLMLMGMVAINSGWFAYVTSVIIYYDKNDLHLTGPENAKIQSLLYLPWSFKPIWGYLSDSFFISGYRYPNF